MLRIRTLRKQRGLTLQQLADQINEAPSAVHYFETGKRDPKSSQLLLIAQALGVSVDELYVTDLPISLKTISDTEEPTHAL